MEDAMAEPGGIDEDVRGAQGTQPVRPHAVAARRTPSRAGRVTRFTFLRRTLMLNFYPVLTVAAGNAILLGVPQAREALGAFRNYAETRESLWANPSYWIFIAALAYWSL